MRDATIKGSRDAYSFVNDPNHELCALPIKNAECISDERSTDSMLNALLDEYRRNRDPIRVNFRELVSWMRYGERATHLIHPYPPIGVIG
jgi:hypothetical protein